MQSMTFNEHDIVRDNAGKFGEKPQSPPETALPEPEDSALDAASLAWAEKFRESEETAVAYLETNAPEGIASIEFEWSDQGDFLEVTGYTMADGTKLDPEGFYDDPHGDEESLFGDDGPDADLFGGLVDAGRFIEAPYDRGIENVDGDGQHLRLTITPAAREREKVTLEQLETAGQAAIEAQRTREGVAVNAIRDTLPEGVDHFVLACSDQGDFLSAAAAYDANGNRIDLEADEDLWYELDVAASHINADAGVGAGDAGLEEHPNHRRNNPLYIIRKARA